MDKTPVQKSKWSRKQGTNKHNASEDRKTNASPKHIADADSESPLHIPLTQEAWGNVDVVWDWNSPQGKPHPKKSQKRLLMPPSPKIPIKKYPSHNSIQNFEKLRGELQALRDEIAIPENEELLQLSPAAEAEYKDISDINLLEEEFQNDFEDLYNSPVNSRLIELAALESSTVSSNTNITQKESVVSTSRSLTFRKLDRNNDVSNIANDSFEALLSEVDIEQLTCNSNDKNAQSSKLLELNHSTLPPSNFHKNSGKVEFHRTESFELSNVEQTSGIAKEQYNDIERKKKEALAKLGSKRKQDQTVRKATYLNMTDLAPNSHCSDEEIEKKRRQALAKLEAKKREQEIIERKRLEALKRLQSRKKNAPIVKSSLTKRLNYETS